MSEPMGVESTDAEWSELWGSEDIPADRIRLNDSVSRATPTIRVSRQRGYIHLGQDDDWCWNRIWLSPRQARQLSAELARVAGEEGGG